MLLVWHPWRFVRRFDRSLDKHLVLSIESSEDPMIDRCLCEYKQPIFVEILQFSKEFPLVVIEQEWEECVHWRWYWSTPHNRHYHRRFSDNWLSHVNVVQWMDQDAMDEDRSKWNFPRCLFHAVERFQYVRFVPLTINRKSRNFREQERIRTWSDTKSSE